jgi:DNA-binding transcriptional MerR regulator
MTKEIRKDLITITDIATAMGMTRAGVYYYEGLGLITPALVAGHIRLFTPDTIDKVKKIKELQTDYKLSAIVKMVKDGKL